MTNEPHRNLELKYQLLPNYLGSESLDINMNVESSEYPKTQENLHLVKVTPITINLLRDTFSD